MKIKRIVAREIFDASGLPTIFCELILNDETFVSASIGSGAIEKSNEILFMRDYDKRLSGMGVQKTIHTIEHTIAPKLIGQEPDVALLDAILLDLDTTENKSVLGGNALSVVSMAVCKAQAAVQGIELFELIAQLSGNESVSLPFPLLTLIENRNNNALFLPFKEILLAPLGAQNFRSALEASVEIFHILKKKLKSAGRQHCISEKGGFITEWSSEQELFDYILDTIRISGLEDLFSLGIDAGANHFYDKGKKLYVLNGQYKASEELIDEYKKYVELYPIFSIEEGCAQHDTAGSQLLYETLSDRVQIVANDILNYDNDILLKAIDEEQLNALVIKPFQKSTVTELLEVVGLCREHEINTLISHRLHETADTFIADFAVGINSGQIKAGGCFRSERIEKYNRLLAIEDMLTMSMLDYL